MKIEINVRLQIGSCPDYSTWTKGWRKDLMQGYPDSQILIVDVDGNARLNTTLIPAMFPIKVYEIGG